jgi:predicted dehydrogenase
MKYAVIGTGYWGQNHVRVAVELMRETDAVNEVVLCDIDEDRVAELATTYDIEFVTDVGELGDRGVDAATLATPSPTHAELATNLLEDGIDVLVEKPLALTSEDAWRIADVAQANDRTLGVGHIFRYHPALNELKRRIDRGELGEIKYLKTNRFSYRVPRETAGALYSLAVHDLDIYQYLVDEVPRRMYCKLDSHIRDGIDETATLVVEYEDATGVINESWQVPVFGKKRDLVVVGTERSAYLDYLEDTKLELFDSRIDQSGDKVRASTEGSQVYETDPAEPLKLEVTDFVESSKAGTTPHASGVVGARTVELLELAVKSDEDGSTVDVFETFSDDQ